MSTTETDMTTDHPGTETWVNPENVAEIRMQTSGTGTWTAKVTLLDRTSFITETYGFLDDLLDEIGRMTKPVRPNS